MSWTTFDVVYLYLAGLALGYWHGADGANFWRMIAIGSLGLWLAWYLRRARSS